MSTIKNKDNKDVVRIDTSSLEDRGTPTWTYLPEEKQITETSITEIPGKTPLIIGLTLQGTEGPFFKNFHRIFVIQDKNNSGTEGEILLERSSINPQEYTLSLSGVVQNEDDIVSVQWTLNNHSRICGQEKRSIQCTHKFLNYGEWSISAEVTLVDGTIVPLQKILTLKAPLELARHVHILDR